MNDRDYNIDFDKLEKRLEDGRKPYRFQAKALMKRVRELEEWLDAADRSADAWRAEWVRVARLLRAAERGDVTAEMVSEVSPYHVWAYLLQSPDWGFLKEKHLYLWRHSGSFRSAAVANQHGVGWSPASAIPQIARAEERGEVAVWLDVRAQEVDTDE